MILAMVGWACATSDDGRPESCRRGSSGNGGTAGAAGDSGGRHDGSAGDGSAGNNGTGGTTRGRRGQQRRHRRRRRQRRRRAAGTAGAPGGARRQRRQRRTAGAAGGGAAAAGTGGGDGRGGSAGGRGGSGGSDGDGAARRGGRGGAGGRAARRRGGHDRARAAARRAPAAAPSSNLCTWPTATGSQSVSSTINVSGTYDGGMKRFTGSGTLGGSGQTEGQGPLFQIANGGTLTNVIIGNPAADGVHCSGSCTLRNVWWEDVGEDAATLLGSSSSQVMTIDTGGAKAATDKVFQHNGPGTMIIRNFCAQDFGKLYRSCGNCSTQYTRHVEIDNIDDHAEARAARGRQRELQRHREVHAHHDPRTPARARICDRYTGNSTGAEPTKIGSGADGTNCIYSASDITCMP